MIFPRLVVYGALLLFVPVAKGKEVSYDWILKPVIDNAFSPDCMNVREERRSMFLAEESFPGPLIEAEEGDIVKVRITNDNHASAVSLHFHGIHQIGTPYSDGVASITQCALGPLQSQEYMFEAYPPGTHYWHGHASFHVVDGLSGPIVIHPKEPEPFADEVDEEIILFLQDWYIETGTQQLEGLLSWPFVWIGNPNSLLINGKGIAPECQPGGSSFNNTLLCLDTCQGDPLALLETVDVAAGMTYRLRLINSAQLVMVNFAITNHTLTIVQVEGTNVEQLTVDSIDIAPGQRYDVLVTADQPVGSYWIETAIRERNIPDVLGRAIFQYAGADAVLPEQSPAHPAHNDTAFGIAQDMSLKTLDVTKHPQAGALSAAEVTRYVLVGTQNQYIVDGEVELLRWAVNNISSILGSVPLISRAAETAQLLGWPSQIADTIDVPLDPPFVWNYTESVNGPDGPGASLGKYEEAVVQFQEGEVVEFVLQNARALNNAAEFHPWHQHGHSFWVVGQGEGIFDPNTDVATYNLVDPVLRDTVTLQPLSWVAIRFVADNPGAWLFHCHITAHHVMGMGLVMLTEPALLVGVSDSVEFCAEHNLEPEDQQLSTNETFPEKGGNSTSGAVRFGLAAWATGALVVLFSMLS